MANQQKQDQTVIPTSDAVLQPNTPNPQDNASQGSPFSDFLLRNGKIISYIIGGILLAGLAFAGYKYYQNQQNELAQAEMFYAQNYFEADSLDKALKGNNNHIGLLEVTESYSGTPAANLANFYVGVIYLKKQKFEEAISHLENFDADDYVLQARKFSLIGDAYLELKNFKNAAKYYKKAAEYKPNKHFSPAYLMKLGLAQEMSKDYKAAADTYDLVTTKYFDAAEAADAKKYKARAQALGQ